MRDSRNILRKDFILKMFGLIVCFVFGCIVPHSASAAMQQVNIDGSTIEICGIDGKAYTPNSFSEDIVILFFGRTGCPNTRAMIEQGKSLINDYSTDKSLKLILMDIDEEDAGMESFAVANPEILIAHNDGKYNSLMFQLLSKAIGENVSSATLPTTFIMGENRKIVFVSTGLDSSGLVDAVLSLTTKMHKHEYETEIVTPPSCTSAGVEVDRCQICGMEKPGSQKELPKTDHIPGTEATCTEPQTCKVCGTVMVAVLGHNYMDTVVAPTDTELGYTLHVCSRCHDSYRDSYVKQIDKSTEQVLQPSEPTDSSNHEPSKPAEEGMHTEQEPADNDDFDSKSIQKPTQKLNLKKPLLRSVKRKSGTKVIVKWKNVAGAEGYELQMSTKSRKGFKRIALLSAKKTSYTKKRLSQKKIYYFRVRAYKKEDGKYYYSAWSKIKKLFGNKKM